MVDEKSEETEEQPQIVHDDIVQRLLNYQRQLREGASAAEAEGVAGGAVATDTIEVVDVAAAEAEGEADIEPSAQEVPETGPSASAEAAADEVVVIPEAELEPESDLALAEEGEATPTGDLPARVDELETTLARLGDQVGELRASFQEMAIDADERLAAIQDAIAAARNGGSSS